MIETNREECQKCKASGVAKACYLNGKAVCEVLIKEEKIMNKANLELNIFTTEFGKMKVATKEYFEKVQEEYGELCHEFHQYNYFAFNKYPAFEKEKIKKNLCSEILDMIQSSISFAQHLIEEDIMTNEDIEAWKEKLEKRKEKYLK